MITDNKLGANSDRLDDETAISPGPTAVNVLKSDTFERSTGVLETPAFGLTLEEKQSIETDITAITPIGVGKSTSAYQKFLNAVLKREVSLSPCLQNHPDAQSIIEALKILFPQKKDSLRLANKKEADESLKRNNHLTGFRDAGSGKIKVVGYCGYAWVDGGMQDGLSPYVGRSLNGLSGHSCGFPCDGRSVIPVFA